MASNPRKAPRKAPTTDKGMPISAKEPPIKWQQTPGMYIAGREALDEADNLFLEMDRKWGVGRLRLIVDGVRREKFDRQRFLLSQARWTGELEDVKRESKRMVQALTFLDKAATDAGKQPIDPSVWEIGIEQGVFRGVVVAIVKESEAIAKVRADGRYTLVYTLDEIGKMIGADAFSLSVKETFPGSEVIAAKQINDPLRPSLFAGEEGIPDVSVPIDDVKWPRDKHGNYSGYIDPDTGEYSRSAPKLNDDVPF